MFDEDKVTVTPDAGTVVSTRALSGIDDLLTDLNDTDGGTNDEAECLRQIGAYVLMGLEQDKPEPARLESEPLSPVDCAAFLLDRADQYETESPCWIALADCAAAIAHGDALESREHGEFDDALYARVARMAVRGR